MQQVCSAMVAHSIFSSLCNHIGLYAVAYTHEAFADASIVDNQTLQRTTCILNLKDTHRATQVATITYLTTTFSIERCDIKYYQGVLRSADTINLDPIHNQANNLTSTSDSLITCEFGWPNALQHFRKGFIISPLGKCACRSTSFLLLLYRLLKARDI